MRRKLSLAGLTLAAFALGFGFRAITALPADGHSAAGRVTGIGGVFFKCREPRKIREWYRTHLGLKTNDYGAVFEWRQGADSAKKGFTQWSPFSEKSTYFAPSDRDFMINYRVENLEALLDQLRRDSVRIVDSIETVDYGKFIHILDPEGNKIELWEPRDAEYEKMGRQMGAETTK
jgi:predicted enzyme related to lactoylglutathione lyase